MLRTLLVIGLGIGLAVVGTSSKADTFDFSFSCSTSCANTIGEVGLGDGFVDSNGNAVPFFGYGSLTATDISQQNATPGEIGEPDSLYYITGGSMTLVVPTGVDAGTYEFTVPGGAYAPPNPAADNYDVNYNDQSAIPYACVSTTGASTGVNYGSSSCSDDYEYDDLLWPVEGTSGGNGYFDVDGVLFVGTGETAGSALSDANSPATFIYWSGMYLYADNIGETESIGSDPYDTLVWLDQFQDPPAVPEPTSLALLGSALIGLGIMRRRRKAQYDAGR